MKVIVAITGASGIVYAKRLVEEIGQDVCLIVSKAGERVARLEDVSLPKVSERYGAHEIEAKPASGSSRYDAMVIVPCSMKTLSAVAHGFGDNLITRAADVMLKEKKKLILVPRETPLSMIHLKNMVRVKEAGGIILPPSPGFYHKPKRIDDLVDFIVGKILDSLEIEHKLVKRWGE
jgi:4-hydroxy-3-polyprenylbenzoate decarboxylase